jgi:hypothetical protein
LRPVIASEASQPISAPAGGAEKIVGAGSGASTRAVRLNGTDAGRFPIEAPGPQPAATIKPIYESHNPDGRVIAQILKIAQFGP